MNVSKITIAFVFSSLTLFASIPAHAKDPCETVLCMYGKLKGANPSECSSAVSDYFSILKKKHGSIRWGKTFTARQQFLDSCPSADRGITTKINSKFGKSRG